MSRARDGPLQFLEDYRGKLPTDAYGGYLEVYRTGRIEHLGCCAHARRYFYQAFKEAPAEITLIIECLQKLYRIERRAKEGQVSQLQRLLLDLRAEGIREPGYVSGETLVGSHDRSLYVVISTWLSFEHWQAWAGSSQRQKLAAEVEQLLTAPEKITVLTLIERL